MRTGRWVAAAALGAALLALMGALAIGMRFVGSDAAEWHRDVTATTRPGTPNDSLVATPRYTKAEPDALLEPGTVEAKAWLQGIDRAAMAEPRTERLAGSPDEGRITYVQRSRLFGFPDYVTAQAEGPNRAIWSRARFGRGDFGVNRARVERWLAAVGE